MLHFAFIYQICDLLQLPHAYIRFVICCGVLYFVYQFCDIAVMCGCVQPGCSRFPSVCARSLICEIQRHLYINVATLWFAIYIHKERHFCRTLPAAFLWWELLCGVCYYIGLSLSRRLSNGVCLWLNFIFDIHLIWYITYLFYMNLCYHMFGLYGLILCFCVWWFISHGCVNTLSLGVHCVLECLLYIALGWWFRLVGNDGVMLSRAFVGDENRLMGRWRCYGEELNCAVPIEIDLLTCV